MLTFWDTTRGCQLADTLIWHLPKLTQAVERKHEAMRLLTMEDNERLMNLLKSGAHFVGSYQDPEGVTVVIVSE